MTDSIHSLVPAYAVDALEADERAMVERHLRECADCRDDLAAFSIATQALGDAQAEAPPASLRARVMAEVARTAQLTPPSADAADTSRDGTATRRGHRGRRRWVPALAGAAATMVVVAVGLGLAGTFGGDGDSSEVAMEKDVMMVTSAPDATSMDVDLGNGHLVKSERMDAFALMGAAAPMPQEGTEYQLWLILEDGSKVAGPTFMPGDDGEYMTVMHGDLDGVVAVAVTCEPPGGSQEPTTGAVSTVEL